MIDAPCKGCDKRFVGCHASCSKYIEYAKYHEEQRQKRRKRRRVVDDMFATQRKSNVISRKRGNKI